MKKDQNSQNFEKKEELEKAREILKVELVKPETFSQAKTLLEGHSATLDRLLEKGAKLVEKYETFRKAYEQVTRPSIRKTIPLGKLEISFELRLRGLEKAWEKTVNTLRQELEKIHSDLVALDKTDEHLPEEIVQSPQTPQDRFLSFLTSKAVLLVASVGIVAVTIPILVLAFVGRNNPSNQIQPPPNQKQGSPSPPQEQNDNQNPIQIPPPSPPNQKQGYFVIEAQVNQAGDRLVWAVHVHKGTTSTYQNENPATGAQVSTRVDLDGSEVKVAQNVGSDGWMRFRTNVPQTLADLYILSVEGALPWLNRSAYLNRPATSFSAVKGPATY